MDKRFARWISCKKIFSAVNCSSPPSRPGAGTWEWDGAQSYGSLVTYTCGLYGNFQDSNGSNYEAQSNTTELTDYIELKLKLKAQSKSCVLYWCLPSYNHQHLPNISHINFSLMFASFLWPNLSTQAVRTFFQSQEF